MDYLKYNDYELLYLMSWHQEQAQDILISKYTNLINIKLRCFKVMDYHFEDYRQECLMALMEAISKYNDSFQKTFYRFAELLIDRKINRLLHNDTRHAIDFYDADILCDKKMDVIENISYQKLVDELNRIAKTKSEKNILRDVIIGGEKAKSYAKRNNLKQKDVYNGLYSIRSRARKKIY